MININAFDIFILILLLIAIFDLFTMNTLTKKLTELILSQFPFYKKTTREPLKSITKAFKDLGNQIKKEVTKAVNAIKKEMNKIKDAILGIFNKIESTFNEITRVLNSIPGRMKKIERGFALSMGAIGLEFENLGKGLNTGFRATFDLIGEGGKTAIGAMECGIEKASWLPQCFPVYIFDGFIWFYTMLFKSIMNAAELYFGFKENYGINYRVVLDYAYNMLEQMDAYAYSFSGVHFMKYPEFILNNCYRCKQLQNTNFIAKAKKVNYAFNEELPRLLNEPIGKFKEAQHEFESAFAP